MNYSLLPSQFNDAMRQAQCNQAPGQSQAYRTLWPRAPMEAADLGIVDQNLDDKIGMEP